MFWSPCWLYLKLRWLLELLPLFCGSKVSQSISSIRGIVLPFLALYPLLLGRIDMLYQLSYIHLSARLICCAPVCVLSVQRSLTVSLHCHFLALFLVFAYENPYLLHITQWTITPTLSSHHRRYCFCTSILHSANTWLIVSSLSPHNTHRGETLCLSTVLFMLFVLIALLLLSLS